jgi:hypothetical protein
MDLPAKAQEEVDLLEVTSSKLFSLFICGAMLIFSG